MLDVSAGHAARRLVASSVVWNNDERVAPATVTDRDAGVSTPKSQGLLSLHSVHSVDDCHRGRQAKIFGWAKSATDLSMTDVRWRKSRNI